MIVIVDYDTGNIGSIKNMITKIGFECTISRDVDVIKSAKKLILPGVGSFDSGMKNLIKFNLIEILNQKVIHEGTPIIGICLGMQLMAEGSDEGTLNGLNWISQKVKRIDEEKCNHTTIPILGWNYIKVHKNNQLLNNIEQRFYFVHSYYFPYDTENSIASANVGFDYCVAFKKENVFGVQFHPEKSHSFGKNVLENFCQL